MAELGVQVYAQHGSCEAVDQIIAAEAAGVSQVWMAQPPAGPDALGVLGAAAVQTSEILLGTSVIPIFPRHPLVTASQALTVAELSDGRLRLGLGTSHKHLVEDVHGIAFKTPHSYLREYVAIVREMLAEGTVDFHGDFYTANASATRTGVPVLVAALSENGFKLAGEISDGAISWLCPPAYLQEVALRAMRAGAELSGRRVPPLVAQMMISMVADHTAATQAAAARIAPNVGMRFYSQMLVRAGLPVADDDDLYQTARELVVAGEPGEIAERLAELLDSGIDELLLSPVFVEDPRREWDLLLAIVSEIT